MSYPCHALLLLSLLVVGPGGPSRERVTIYIGKEGRTQ